MTPLLLSRLTALALTLASACSSREGEPAKTARAEAGEATEAEADMCAEHGVLEAICTKCHPKLIAIFRAKGDFCEEHGLPLSVCPIHHPERKGRPAQEIVDDKAPADGTRVRLKNQDTARLAGIKTAAAQRRPGGARLEALAQLTYDATKWAQINARAAGVVRAVKVDVGAVVKAGAQLAFIESALVGADRSRLVAAASRVEIAEANLKREQQLFAQGLSAQKEMLTAQQELDSARAERDAARAAVGVVGASGATGSGYALTAPIAGVVTKRNVTLGNMVNADETVLFEIVDTRTMRAEIEIPETELRRVRIGQEVAFTAEALPELERTGTIDYLAPDVDRETRTVKARATLDNPDGNLRANMFGRARISLGAAAETVMVPRQAVQRAGEVELVFVALGDGQYEARRVKTGAREGQEVEVMSGIQDDEQVVTEGSFLLKTETLKGSIGAGCCEPGK